MTALKLTTIGSSTGAVIPKEMLARLKVQKGDTLYAIETPEGLPAHPLRPHNRRTTRGRASSSCETIATTFRALAK